MIVVDTASSGSKILAFESVSSDCKALFGVFSINITYKFRKDNFITTW